REHGTGGKAADQAEGRNESCPKPEVAAKSSRPRALSLEVEEVAALVTQVGDDDEQEPDHSEHQRRESRGGERDQRPARERVGAEVREQTGARRDLQSVEWRAFQRRLDLSFAMPRGVEPDL